MLVWICVGVLANGIIGQQMAEDIQSSLYLPTAIVLVIYVVLSVVFELDKPKYRAMAKSKNGICAGLLLLGLAFIGAVVYFKYLA